MPTRYIVDHINISSEDFDGETVCVNFATGTYFGLNLTAGAILDFFSAPHTKDEALQFITAQFGVDKAHTQDDIDSFIDSLIKEKLLLTADDDAIAETKPADIPDDAKYEPPRFEIYTDLQELIMLDPVHDTDPEHGWPQRRADLDQ
ncbi:MAG: PqqD family protein [Pseudomonadota bacterium]